MSQRTHQLNNEFTIDLKLKVKLKSFSNHNGFTEKQIKNAVEEFEEEIRKELEHKVCDDFQQGQFLESVGFVNYEVEAVSGSELQPEMKDLPQWIQDLWKLNPTLARKAEKYYIPFKDN